MEGDALLPAARRAATRPGPDAAGQPSTATSDGCTVIGGNVYRGAAQPALAGGYLFADYCSGTIWAIDPTSDELRAPTVVGEMDGSLSSFGEDEAGELYVTDLSGGRLLKVSASRG